MPYRIEKRGGPRPFKIVRADTGKVVGSSTSDEAAHASMHARLAGEHGWKPTRRMMTR